MAKKTSWTKYLTSWLILALIMILVNLILGIFNIDALFQALITFVIWLFSVYAIALQRDLSFWKFLSLAILINILVTSIFVMLVLVVVF